MEETAKLEPDVASSGAVSDHEVEELHGCEGVEPLDDGEIVFHPTRIVRRGCNVAGDTVEKGAMPEMDLEKMTPMIIVVAVEIEDNGDEWSYVRDRVGERE